MKWTFRSGERIVTVRAKDRATAIEKAMAELDRRIIKAGSEPPVGYVLMLVVVEDE